MAIGVFDSGLGGLSVLSHLKKHLRHESFIYVADSANAPYGDKSEDFIQQRCLSISKFLSKNKITAIVVACNTATAAAVELIRDNLDIPVVAIEPALKPASFQTKTGKVGVLATASTLNSSQYKNLLNKFSNHVDYYEQAAHGLVEQVESGQLNNLKTQALLEQYLNPMLKTGIDCVVLGCTHYPFLLPAIKKIVGENVCVIDTGAAIAEQLSNVLNDIQVSTLSTSKQHDRYFSSADINNTKEMIEVLLGLEVEVEKLPI